MGCLVDVCGSRYHCFLLTFEEDDMMVSWWIDGWLLQRCSGPVGVPSRRVSPEIYSACAQFTAAILQTSLQLQLPHNCWHLTNASTPKQISPWSSHQNLKTPSTMRTHTQPVLVRYRQRSDSRPHPLPLAVLPRPKRREPGRTASDAHASRLPRRGEGHSR